MKKVWILFSVANDYNQPEKAFEAIWWHKPTYEELKDFGFTETDAQNMCRPNRGGQTEYWVEEITEK
jgi:hypothetical protein